MGRSQVDYQAPKQKRNPNTKIQMARLKEDSSTDAAKGKKKLRLS